MPEERWRHLPYVTHIATLYGIVIDVKKVCHAENILTPMDNVIVLGHFFNSTKKSNLIGRL